MAIVDWLAEAYYCNQEYYVRVHPFFSNLEFNDRQTVNLMFLTVCHSSNLTQSCFNLFVYRTCNKNLSIDDIKKYFKEDHFTFLVVEANELYFGFDQRKAAEFDITVKIVTQSFPSVGIDGKNVDGMVVG